MFVKASQILNQPVFAQKEETRVGRVVEILIDPQNTQLLGFLITQPFSKPRLVSDIDVLQIFPEGILINSADSLIEPTEVVKVAQILEEKIKVLGAKVETESGKKLGQVEDFVLETQTGSLIKIYIRGGFFLPSLILPVESIIRIKRDKVIVSDQFLDNSETVEVFPA